MVEIVTANGFAEEVFGQPLGGLWGIDDELGPPWGRTDDDLARVVHEACTEQIGSAPTGH